MSRMYMWETNKEGYRLCIEKFYYNGQIDKNCKVYIFVFQGFVQLSPELQQALTELGKKYGENLFVGFWAEDDPFFTKAVELFNIKSYPTIIITGNADLAMSGELQQSVYVKLDYSQILKDTKYLDLVKQTLGQIYLSFLSKDFQQAIKQAKSAQDIGKAEEILYKFLNAIKNVFDFISKYNITFKFGGFGIGVEQKGSS